MKIQYSLGATLALAFTLVGTPATAQTVTPAQWLAAQPKPAFKPGHTLPRLTRYGYEVPIDVTKELTERWGYALQLHAGYLDPEVVARLDNPNSREAKIVALTRSDPAKYPLFITTSRQMPQLGDPGVPDSTWTRNASGQALTSRLGSADGNLWSPGKEPIFSTEAPDSVWALAGKYRADPLRALVARGVPVSIVLNGGEYGMGHVGADDLSAGPYWAEDPAHNNALANSIWGGGRYGHSSAKKANSERIIADAVRAAAPQRSLYVYYSAGGRTLRNKFWGTDSYGGYWEHFRGISDKPSSEIYFKHFNDGFTGAFNVLTLALNAASMEIATGDGLSYNWITAGWDRGDPTIHTADINRWTGFLKCYFTAGMIGGNVGAYGDTNASLAASFQSNAPNFHYKDLIAASHVQALFSHVEDLVRSSDLLPGPGRHEMSQGQSAYEFPTGDNTARVLARKNRKNATWLITAWAADGADRNVTVYIPELGQVTVQARAVGSVYTAILSKGNVTLTRLDDEGATYTAVGKGRPVTKPVNLVIPPPIATNRLLWLAADQGVTADAAGKVSAWTSQTGGVKVSQATANRRPTLIANAIGGKPALRFVTGQTWLDNLSLGAAGDSYTGPLTIFSVFTGGGINSNKRVLSGVAAGGVDYLASGIYFNDSVTNLDEIRDGVILKTAATSINAPLQQLSIGEGTANTGPGNGNGLTGDIAEVLVYKRLSKLAEAQVTSYLRDKYRITPNTVIVNGSFEDHAVGAGYQYAQYTPQSGGWIHASKAAVQANGSAWGASSAPNGTQTGVLQGGVNDLGSISQAVDFAAGSYRLTFKAARRASDAGRTQPIKISIDGNQVGALITPPSNAFTDFTTVVFNVSAGLHTVRLEATNGSAFNTSTFIDQVALKQVLECRPNQ